MRHDDAEQYEAALDEQQEFLDPVKALEQAKALLDDIVGGDKLYDPGTDEEHESRAALLAEYERLHTRYHEVMRYRGNVVDETVVTGRVRGLYSANRNCGCCAGKGYPGHRYRVALEMDGEDQWELGPSILNTLADAEDGAYVTITITTSEEADRGQ